MPKIEAVVFDLDGLMVDTKTTARQAWRIVLKRMGFSFENEVYHRLIGRRSDETAVIIKARHGLSLSPEELFKKKTTAFPQMLHKDVPIMPGLRRLHKEIISANIPWAVATSSPRRYAQDMLAIIKLNKGCRAIVGGDEVERGKPFSDIYLLAAERLALTPAKCLALEDSVPGCRAAIAAGMETVTVPGTLSRGDDFSFVRYVFSSLSKVAKSLEALIKPSNG